MITLDVINDVESNKTEINPSSPDCIPYFHPLIFHLTNNTFFKCSFMRCY